LKLKTENLKLKKISISEEALSQEVNGETVILDLKSESYFGLDEVGTRVWQLLQEHGDIQKVFDAMLEEFDVDANTLASDMKNLVDDLIEKGLISSGHP
jgi:sorbitol-specific phosphotransferase system component IIA